MHPRDLCGAGRGDHPGQRLGGRTVILYLIALSVIAGALIVSGCSGDDEDGRIRSANLNGSQERPQAVTTAATGSVALTINPDQRSEERRVGKEWRSRRSHERQKENETGREHDQ